MLDVGRETLRKDMSEHSGFVYLAHKVGNGEAKAVAKLNLVGINLLPDTERVDPAGQLAAPVLGEVGAEGTGLSGLEYQYNNLLGGPERDGEDRAVAERGDAARAARRS